MKTLVIEDSPISLKSICDHIERMGITPIPAKTGAEGIELFLKERPDIVLLDIIMPDVDGYEVARSIRESEESGDWTPIIFLSSLSADKDIEKGIAAGGDDYLLKPISKIVLGAKIRAMLRIIQMRQTLVAMTHELDAANHELRLLTSVDCLTGLSNRRHFESLLMREWNRSMRQGEELSILMCDIDFFKSYNDTYGHPSGDQCLRKVASALSGCMVRGGDLLARYGGEEFVAILPATELSGAIHVGAQMRQAVMHLDIPHSASPLKRVTASFGVASAVAMPETKPYDVVMAADQALYKAKNAGRNRVHVKTSLDPDEN